MYYSIGSMSGTGIGEPRASATARQTSLAPIPAAIRKNAESRQKSIFRLRDFHDAPVAAGAATIPVLRAAMHDWIQSRNALLSEATQ